MKHKIIYLLTIAVVAFTGCKSTKSISKSVTHTANPAVQLIDQVQKVQPAFNTANVSKMSIEMDISQRKLNVSASAKIRRDSAMHVSFQVFGMEVFKVEMQPDSMRILDKMNRKYYVVDYGYLNKRFGVDADYYSLQSLFSAQFFCVGQRNPIADSCKLEAGANGANTLDYQTANMIQKTTVSAANLIQSVWIQARNSSYVLKTAYSDYAPLNGVNFPQTILMEANNDNTTAICKFSILKADFNTALKFQTVNTERYTRGDIEQILKK